MHIRFDQTFTPIFTFYISHIEKNGTIVDYITFQQQTTKHMNKNKITNLGNANRVLTVVGFCIQMKLVFFPYHHPENFIIRVFHL